MHGCARFHFGVLRCASFRLFVCVFLEGEHHRPQTRIRISRSPNHQTPDLSKLSSESKILTRQKTFDESRPTETRSIKRNACSIDEEAMSPSGARANWRHSKYFEAPRAACSPQVPAKHEASLAVPWRRQRSERPSQRPRPRIEPSPADLWRK